MSTIWVVSANSAAANFYTARTAIAPLAEQKQLSHPASRKKQSELVTDQAGRAFDSAGQGRHAMEQRVNAHEHEHEVFAREVAQELETIRDQHDIQRLVLVAAPAFLGMLRAELSEPLKALVSLEIDKDYTSLRPDELRARLPERL